MFLNDSGATTRPHGLAAPVAEIEAEIETEIEAEIETEIETEIEQVEFRRRSGAGARMAGKMLRISQ